MIARRIYWAALILSVAMGIYFYGIAPEKYDPDFLTLFSILPFFLFAGSIHGLMAGLLTPTQKHKMVVYPIIMGLIYSLLFIFHLYIVVPMVCGNL